MVDKEYFESEDYRFYFRQSRTRAHIEQFVSVDILPIERMRKVTDEDIHKLKGFFNDMGKWENFVKAGKGLFRDLGVLGEIEKEEKREFGAEKYEKTFAKSEDEEFIAVTIRLTTKESLRRSKGASEHETLPVEEVSEQAKNVLKWRRLKKAMLQLKGKLQHTRA